MRRHYSLNQVEYWRNFIFRRNFPIHKLFQRSAELGVFCVTADKIAQIFGVRKHKRLRGKLHSMLEKLDHGHHVLRIYCKSLVARLYEKFSTFLRLEICVNRLKDLGLNKGLQNLGALREKLVPATDRLAALEAELLNVHVDFPRICGALANSLFHHQPTPDPKPAAKIETAYHKADAAIQNLIWIPPIGLT